MFHPLTLWAGATVISHYLTIKSQELIKWPRSGVQSTFPSEPSPIISKASCNLLRAFQVCETPLPTAGKSLLPAVIKTDNLTGEKRVVVWGVGCGWRREKRAKERNGWGLSGGWSSSREPSIRNVLWLWGDRWPASGEKCCLLKASEWHLFSD